SQTNIIDGADRERSKWPASTPRSTVDANVMLENTQVYGGCVLSMNRPSTHLSTVSARLAFSVITPAGFPSNGTNLISSQYASMKKIAAAACTQMGVAKSRMPAMR